MLPFRIKGKLFGNSFTVDFKKFIIILGVNGAGKSLLGGILKVYLNEGVILPTIKLFDELKIHFIDDFGQVIVKDLCNLETIKPLEHVESYHDEIIDKINFLYNHLIKIKNDKIYYAESNQLADSGLARSINENLLSKINSNPVKLFDLPEKSQGFQVIKSLGAVLKSYSGLCIIITHSPELLEYFSEEGIINL